MPKIILRCQNCGSTEVRKNGAGRVICKNCHTTGVLMSDEDIGKRSEKVNANGTGEISTITTKRIRTLADLVEICEIDTNEWIIDHWVANKWEMGAKDADDKLQIEPLFQVKAWLKPRKQEKALERIAADLMADAKRHAPQYKRIKYPKPESHLYEIDFPARSAQPGTLWFFVSYWNPIVSANGRDTNRRSGLFAYGCVHSKQAGCVAGTSRLPLVRQAAFFATA